MLSALLMQPILSQGEDGAIEAVLSAVLERINKTDGTICHEENLGDYATFLARKEGISSTDPSCDYKMIDTDFLLPILMKNYFLDTDVGRDRATPFINRKASFLPDNVGTPYIALAQQTALKIMSITAPFAANQVPSNLLHILPNQSVGQWRDSGSGLGGGRTPYDVNTALAPAGLRAIAALSAAGFFPDHPEWAEDAARYAKIWEDETLRFFEVSVGKEDARKLVEEYVDTADLAIPSHSEDIEGNITFYSVSLSEDGTPVRVMNTDDCFRLYLLNPTNQTQLTSFLHQTASHILHEFPVGLHTEVGLFVSNPAYSDADLQGSFKNSDYHGTVVWSWQLAMMAAGLARQLSRCKACSPCKVCDTPGTSPSPSPLLSFPIPSPPHPLFFSFSKLTTRTHTAFCTTPTHQNVKQAYTKLWDTIDANRAQLSGEVWSWKYEDGYRAVPLSAFSSTESDIVQLWSLTFLAIHREEF